MQDDSRQYQASAVGWPSLLGVSVAVVSGVWVTGSRFWSSTWHGFPNTALTTLFFLVAAAAANRGVPACYKWSIVAGLGCSAVGDVFLMARGDYFVAGLASFLAAHICYLCAFTRDSEFAGCKLPFVVWGVFGVALVSWLWPGVAGPLQIPVVIYAAALLAMAAQAANRAASSRDLAAILAAVGAGLFVVSDSVLAFQRFRQPLEWGHVAVLGTYFAAQCGIALSAVVYRGRAA